MAAADGMAPNWHHGFNNCNDDLGRSEFLGSIPARFYV